MQLDSFHHRVAIWRSFELIETLKPPDDWSGGFMLFTGEEARSCAHDQVWRSRKAQRPFDQ